MNDPFVHLHVHSEYSFLDGYGHPSQFVARAKELGQAAIAITDHGNVSAHKKWYDACKKVGIKPLLGVEAYVVDDSEKRDSRRMWHITLLAKNLIGYRNVLAIVTRSWEHGFYYKPRTDWQTLKQYSEGLIATSGCPSGRLGRGITHDHWRGQSVVDELKRQAALFNDYYVEVSPWQYAEGITVAQEVYAAARKEGLPLVLTMDAHYPNADDAYTQDVMLCIQNNVKFSDPERMKFSQQDFCINSGPEMVAKWEVIHGNRLPLLDEMILNTGKIAESVELEFPRATPLSFQHKGDKTDLLRQWCEQGMDRRKVNDRPAYRERLEYEFGLVKAKHFEDYFLVVADMIVWAKDNGILVGPARGSSCGSLMCYVLRITEIDPILHGLMFERFIDMSRADLPDIDIDFESERRNEVKTYLGMKYGHDRVANLATFGTFKGKLCLQDIGRVFSDKIPWGAVEETKRLIVQRSSADSRAGYTVEDTFVNFEQAAGHLKKYPELGLAKKLEGQIRQLGIHAAGVVISNEPVGNFASMYVTSKKERVISMDYADATSVGLLKIDILGLTALTAMKRAMTLIKNRHDIDIDLERLRLDDEEVYDNFCRQHLQGIFQFEGESTRQVCRQVQPRTFEDLVAINALSRPGPLHSGGTTSFIERRFGREKVVALHPMLDEIVKPTYGITVYQEQVMQVVRLMGKFDWSGITAVRKMMSKKYGDEAFGAMRDKFVEGATSQGVAKENALAVWANICTFGSWAFNKSHSVAYSVMAYQLMWLKTHYPIEFYASVIACEPVADKQRKLFKEYVGDGEKVLPVCINASELNVSCDGKGLRLGFDAVVGLGEKVAVKIIANRPYSGNIDFNRRCKIPQAQTERLLKIGSLRELKFDALTSQQDLFGANESQTATFDYRNPKDSDVREWCPLAADNRVLANWQVWIKKNIKGELSSIRLLDDISDRKDVMVFGCTDSRTGFNLKNKMEEAVSRGKEWKAKEGEEGLTKGDYTFLNFNLEDDSDLIVVRVSYKQYPKFKSLLWAIKPDEPLIVRGMVTGVMRMVFAFGIMSLPQLKLKLDGNRKLTKTELDFVNGRKETFRR